MFKFLRKYQAVILVFGGALLMVAFLVPQALQQLGKGAGAQVLGTIDGKTLTGKSYNTARQELEIINSVMPEFVSTWDVGVEHWLLLSIEADRHGVSGGQLDGRNLLPQLADDYVRTLSRFQNPPLDQVQTDALRQGRLDFLNTTLDAMRLRGYSEADTFGALGKLSGVLRLIQLHQVSLPLSTPEAWALGMELFDTATVDIVALFGDDLAPDPATLSRGQLDSHFEQFRAQRPEDNDFGIGYRLSDAVRLEMLIIDRSALNDAVDVDPIELRLHFDELQKQNILVGQTFEASRDQVRGSYVTEQSAELLDELTLEVRRKLLMSRVGIHPIDGFFRLPKEWPQQRPTLEVLAEAVRQKVPKADLASAVVRLRTDDTVMLDADALAALDGVAGATFRVNERLSIPFVEYILGVRELGRGEDRFALQQDFLPAQPMRITGGANEGDVIWVRVTGARPESPATEWQSIEAQMRTDLASLEGYRALLGQRDDIVSQVGGTGPDAGVAVILDLDMPSATYNIEGIITRQAIRLADGTTTFPEADSQDFRDAVMDLVKPWDPALDVATLPLEQRTTSAVDPTERRLIIGQVTDRTPMTMEQFSRNAASIVSRARAQIGQPEIDPFSFEAVSKRLGYKSADRSQSDDEDDVEEMQPENDTE